MMPFNNTMGYYHQFPNAIPRPWVRCVRVTHPSAGVLLPLDLHVLGLPLAFILSQDQTLHRVFFGNWPEKYQSPEFFKQAE
jgi:hypothetical protein